VNEDRKLLEQAAKALGWRVTTYSERRSTGVVDGGMAVVVAEGRTFGWSPLHDDGDAFRLAVKLNIDIAFDTAPDGPYVQTVTGWSDTMHCDAQDLGKDAGSATRRAIVRTAAAIGESMGAK
jgi:hypothetical protein